MWSIEHDHPTKATPEEVFAVWADVANWPKWDPSLISATLNGDFDPGTTGTLHPDGAPEPVTFTLTAVDQGRGFADETFLGPLALRFIHRAEPERNGARITIRVEAEGPDEDQVGPMVAADLPESTEALAAAAEGRRAEA